MRSLGPKVDVVQLVAQRISGWILRRGYDTVERFAYENGLDKSALSKILKGRRRPRFDTLIRIAEALEVTLNDLYLPEGASLVREGQKHYQPKARGRNTSRKTAGS